MRVQFGEFTLDAGSRQLLRKGQEVHLIPKAFDLLQLLLERRPDAVSRREIRDGLWPDTFVSESTLTSHVTDLRAALDDDAKAPRFVRTVCALRLFSEPQVLQDGDEIRIGRTVLTFRALRGRLTTEVEP